MFLDLECGEDVCEVSVNGSASLVAPWAPYRFDVGGLLKPGKNTLEIRVTNTLINVLEGVKKPSGLAQPPRVVHHHRCVLPIKPRKG
jgi:hypothetical protein